VLAYFPTYLQMGLQFSAFEAGLLMLPMVATTTVASTLIGFLVARTGKWILVAASGALTTAAGAFLLSTLNANSSAALVVIFTSIIGIGVGTNVLLLTLVAQNAVEDRFIGVATSTNNFFRQVGAAIGISGFGYIFAVRLETELRRHFP